ncbi:MAG: amino acid adenylation domain-containing protein, partial [Lysobacter sp.]|nr:amino acid adenylation domain-containing protein [Lysobacter sp.]
LSLPGLTLSPMSTPHVTTHFDLSLALTDTGDGLAGGLVYASDLFDEATMVRGVGQFERLLTGMVADADQRVRDLPLLSEAERHQLLVEFNDTATAYPQDGLIHGLFEAQVERSPDATALVYEGEALSYAELNRRSNEVAHRLLSLGVKPDDRVAICAERSVEMVVGMLGILKAGGAYVPLDPGLPSERLAFMVSDSGPVALLTQTALLETVSGWLPSGQSLPVVVLDGAAGSELASHPTHNPAVAGLASNHLAYVIYTSGSTGQPKGVLVEHRAAANFWNVLRETTHKTCPPFSKVGLNSAYSFDMSLKGLLQLLSGHCLVIVPDRVRASGEDFIGFIKDNELSAFECTPSQLDMLLSAGLTRHRFARKCNVLLGGEAIGQSAWETIRDFTAFEFHNMYGPTECTVDATIGRIHASDERPHIGRPIANVKIHILDERLEPVPLGVAGELYVGGAGLARGYLNRPELTAERFVKNPFSAEPEARMYKTGDLARWLPDGNIEYVGRNDFQVKIRGFRIELGEIEAKLLACEGVREAVVIAREDVEGDKRLVAYVVPHEGIALAVAALRESLALELAEYMVPSAFVSLDALPLTRNGKLDRKSLPAPDQSSVASRQYEAPTGEVEQAIASIWQELLGLERVGRHDHFFEMGGHSLLAVQLVSRLRQALGVEVGLRELFAEPTLSALALTLANANQATLSPILPADRSAALPLSWAQQRLWFLDQMDHAAGGAYHMPAALHLQGVLDRAALQ